MILPHMQYFSLLAVDLITVVNECVLSDGIHLINLRRGKGCKISKLNHIKERFNFFPGLIRIFRLYHSYQKAILRHLSRSVRLTPNPQLFVPHRPSWRPRQPKVGTPSSQKLIHSN
jgi:hypothetical protein